MTRERLHSSDDEWERLSWFDKWRYLVHVAIADWREGDPVPAVVVTLGLVLNVAAFVVIGVYAWKALS